MKILAVFLLVCAMIALTTARRRGPWGWWGRRTGSPSCHSGWTGFNDHCFLFVSTVKTWADAEKHCQSHDGNLASVHNADEYHKVQDMIKKISDPHPKAWLGGSDAQQEGTWMWSDGTPFSFPHWSPGQADGHEHENCLVINHGANKKFDDQPCSHKMPFVCAKYP